MATLTGNGNSDEERRDALVERLFDATVGALELFGVHLGWRLGLYAAMADGDPSSPAGLAERAGIDERYAREWLEQQAVAGVLDVVEGEPRRFTLPAGHAEVLARPDSPTHVAPFAPLIVGIAGALPDVVEAYRTGAGVPFARYGPDLREGQAAINRPLFIHELAGWLAADPALKARLGADPPARVADLGCGEGASTIALARACPNALVDGIDLDEASIEAARRDAAAAGIEHGLSFAVRDAALLDAGAYDLVCIFEALHDMSRPVEALAAAREALAPGGRLLVADERVAESFTAPGDPVERIMYGWSISHCLPASRAEQPSAALGTVLRADTVRRLAGEAGFASTEVLPIENDFFRFYLMEP